MTPENTVHENGLRVAVLSDIHGNIRALNAALDEVAREQPDRIVVCGDVASGPFPAATIDRLMALGEPALFVRGNADRELVSAFDHAFPYDPGETDAARLFAAWAAQHIDQRQRDFLAGFHDRLSLEIAGLGRVLFCHGTPASDEEIITCLTPPARLEIICAGLEEEIVVCGHTHHRFDLQAGDRRVINAGSVGMPYEGKPGAFWAILGPGVEFRRSTYDAERAAEEALAAGYPDPSYAETLLAPPTPVEVAEFFEKVAADRGERS
jgi:putative phosphoesterase